jgi:hypothetical protein
LVGLLVPSCGQRQADLFNPENAVVIYKGFVVARFIYPDNGGIGRFFKTADESAGYKEIRPRIAEELIKSHFPGPAFPDKGVKGKAGF